MAFEDFKRTLESVHAAIAITDAKGAIAFANPAFAELAGRFRAELEGSAFASLFAPDARKRKAAAGGVAGRGERHAKRSERAQLRKTQEAGVVDGRLILVATNTGFAPIWSIAVAALRENPERTMIIVAGGRNIESLYMVPALVQLARFPFENHHVTIAANSLVRIN